LTVVDDSTLCISTPGSLFNHGELVRFAFDATGVESVNYGGFTMLPESATCRVLP